MYDPLKLCESEERDGKEWHVADPAVVLPATIARIVEVLTDKKQFLLPPEEITNMEDEDPWLASRAMVKEASSVPATAWDAALKPFVPTGKDKEADAINKDMRAQALAVAWSWFKRSLSLKKGKTVLLHITRDETYKE